MPGETDAAVIFKPTPGSKRWQHIAREGSNAEAEQLITEDNYCVILGSHRNSSLKVEKCGIQCAMVRMLSQRGIDVCSTEGLERVQTGVHILAGTECPGVPAVGNKVPAILDHIRPRRVQHRHWVARQPFLVLLEGS